MLKDLIISKVRIKILQLFLLNPGKIYHVREIVRQIGEEINAVRRELAHMEKARMVSKEKRANRLYYSFRQDYPLYFELLELINKTTGLGAEIIRRKIKLGKIKFAMFTGRSVRGLPRKPDEVDFLVVGDIVLPELSQIVRNEETKREREINYTVMTEEEFEFRKKRNDPFIIKVLSGARIMLVGDEEEMIG